MGQQLCFEDIDIGTEILSLVKQPTSEQLVRWAGASEDFNPLHYDASFAKSKGMEVIVHGRLKNAFLIQMMTDWIGDGGQLRKISIQHRAMDYPGQTIVCKGKVTKKDIESGEGCVECEIWAENEKGEKTAPGTATVILPSNR